jgi:hypothetical protein
VDENDTVDLVPDRGIFTLGRRRRRPAACEEVAFDLILADFVRTRKQRLNFRLLDGLCRGSGRTAAVAFDLSPDGFVGIALQRGRHLRPFSFVGQIVD